MSRTGNRIIPKIIFPLLFFLFIGSYASIAGAASIRTVSVSNVGELLRAIGPDRVIKLKPGTYTLPTEDLSDNPYLAWEEVFDGYELVIKNLSGLTIEGQGERTKILAEPRYAFVFRFENVSQVSIKNVVAGHTEEGYCAGGVFSFFQSKNISIQDSILFGCGTEGLRLEKVSDLQFTNSVIKECTYGIMTVINSERIFFKKATFFDNREFDLITIERGVDIHFDDCDIRDNIANPSDFPGYSLFLVTDSTVTVKNTRIRNNQADYFNCGDHPITVKDSTFTKNEWRKGEFFDLPAYEREMEERYQGDNDPILSRLNSLNLQYSDLSSRYNELAETGFDREQMEMLVDDWKQALTELEELYPSLNSSFYSELTIAQFYELGVKLKVEYCWEKAEFHYKKLAALDDPENNGYGHLALGNFYLESCIKTDIEESEEGRTIRFTVVPGQSKLLDLALAEYKEVNESKFSFELFLTYFFLGRFKEAAGYTEMWLKVCPEEQKEIIGMLWDEVKEKGSSKEKPKMLEITI